MKNKIIIILSISVLAILVTFIILNLDFSSSVNVISLKKSYSVIINEDDYKLIEVPLYLSNNNNKFTDNYTFENAYITDENKETLIKVSLSNISSTKVKENFNDKNYYLYNYLFKIKSELKDEITINNAYLYLENNDIMFDIGSFYYNNIDSNSTHINLLKTKPIINKINRKETLLGLNIIINNNTNSQITIKEIKPLKSNISISYKDIKIAPDIKSSTQNINEILGYNYDIYGPSDNKSLNINVDKQIELILPIKYTNDLQVKSLGFIIEYEINSVTYSYLFNEFLFFDSESNNLQVIDRKEIKEYIHDKY